MLPQQHVTLNSFNVLTISLSLSSAFSVHVQHLMPFLMIFLIWIIVISVV